MALLKLAIAGLAGYGLYKYSQRSAANGAVDYKKPAFAQGEDPDDNFAQIRNAGPSSMRDTPRRWHPIDEASDQSFPASDPPSTY